MKKNFFLILITFFSNNYPGGSGSEIASIAGAVATSSIAVQTTQYVSAVTPLVESESAKEVARHNKYIQQCNACGSSGSECEAGVPAAECIKGYRPCSGLGCDD